MRKLFLIILLIPGALFSQTITSTVSGGSWDQTSTWVGGVVPIFNNSSAISIVGPVTVSSTFYNSSTPLVIDQITINSGGTLTIEEGSQVNINAGAGTDLTVTGTGQLQVNGSLIQVSGATFSTTAANTFFNANSIYEHRNTSFGTLLTASWDPSSTILVSGLNAGSNAGATWAQSIGNLIFNCPNLGAGVASLQGQLTSIAGNFSVIRTGTTGRLMFSNGAGVINVNIGGNLEIGDGTQEAALWVTSSGTVTVTVGGSVTLASTSATPSQNATTGTGIIQVNGGDFSLQSGTWNFLSGAGTGTIILDGGNFLASSSVSRTGGGSATISFIGSAANQGIDLNPLLITSGTINLSIGKTSGNLNFQSPITIGSYTQSGGVTVLNGEPFTINGIINQTGGNIDASTNSSISIGGAGAILTGLVFSPAPALFETFTLNRAGVTFNSTSLFQIGTLNLTAGTLTNPSITIEDQGLINVVAGVLTNAPTAVGVYDVSYANTAALNTGNELPTSPSTIIRNLSKSAAGTLTLTQNIEINGDLTLSGGTFAGGTNTISLDGNFVSNGAFTAAAGGTFQFEGTTGLSGSTLPTFRDIVVNGTLTPSIGYGVNGNYTVNPGGTVNAGSGTVTFGGTTVITNSGTMNLNAVTIANTFSMTAPSTILGIAGNFTSTGTFNNGGGTILFNGTSNLTATEVYNNIQVSGVVTSTGNFAQTIAGNLINNGSFSIGTGTLTWSGSGSLSGSGNTIVGDLTVTGTFSSTSSGNITLNDDLLGTGVFDSSGSTGSVIFAGAGSAINRTGTTTFRNLSITGTLTPTTSYTLAGAGGINVTGTLVSASTVIFAGTTQTITGSSSAIAFNNVTTNVGSTLSITPNITINGNLIGNGDISSAATITFVGLTMNGTGAKLFTNVTVGTGTLTPNCNYSIAGSLIVNGTLAAGNGTTTFNGTTTITGAGGKTFNFLTIAPGATLTSFAGTVSVVRDFTNNGNFLNNGGTISFSTAGTAQQQIAGSNSILFNNLVVNNVGVATDVINAISPGQTVDIEGTLSFGEANAVFDADGAGTAITRIVSFGDSPADEGRIGAITFAGSNISGNITVQRFVSNESTGRFYRYIASPVVGATVDQLKAVIPVTGTFTDPSDGFSSPPCVGCVSSSPSLFSFNEATASTYIPFPAAGLASASAFANGRGYSAFFRHTGTGSVGDVTLSFRGTNPSTAAIALPVSPNAGGFSLVGNPYPSPIVWGATGWTRTNIGDVIVVRDNATGVHESHGTADNFIIATGQSFWVQSSAGGASLQISETAKSSTGTYEFYREGDDITNSIDLILTKKATGVADNAKVTLVEGSSANYDPFDGVKFDNSVDDGSTIIQVHDIFTLSNDASPIRLDVNALPAVCSQNLKVNIRDVLLSGESSTEYTLVIQPMGSLQAIQWTLFDAKTSTDIPVTENFSYTFTVEVGETTLSSGRYHLSNRFTLKSSTSTLDVSKSVSALSPTLCNGFDASILVASQPAFSYRAEVNGLLLDDVAQGNGSSLLIFIPKDQLTLGVNDIRIKANSGCSQEFLTSTVAVNVVEPYQISSITTASLCKPGSTTINAASMQGDANFNWYSSATSSEVLGTGGSFITPTISDSTTYYVEAVSPNGCTSERLPVGISFENNSATVSLNNVLPVCAGMSATLSASSTLEGGEFFWYDNVSATQPVGSGSTFITPVLSSTQTYFVSIKSASGCEGERLPVLASVMEFNPILNTISERESVCLNGQNTFVVEGAPEGSSYHWFETSDGTEAIFVGSTFVVNDIVQAQDFFVSAISETGCETPRIQVRVNVDTFNETPDFTYSYNQICKDDETDIAIQSSSMPNQKEFKWYSSPSGNDLLFEGSTYRTQSLSNNMSYYVSAVNGNGCESIVRKKVDVLVTTFPSPEIDLSVEGELRSNFESGNQWFWDNSALIGETNQILVLAGKNGLFELQVNYEGCTDQSGSVLVTNLVTSLEDLSMEVNLYPNPASEILKLIINSTEKVEAVLIDQTGKPIGFFNLRPFSSGLEGEINIKELNSGLYFLQLTSKGKSVTHKVIKR